MLSVVSVVNFFIVKAIGLAASGEMGIELRINAMMALSIAIRESWIRGQY
ncbi:MAG: hypothetical protein ACI965_002022 [Paraglaciecola sp.]